MHDYSQDGPLVRWVNKHPLATILTLFLFGQLIDAFVTKGHIWK